MSIKFAPHPKVSINICCFCFVVGAGDHDRDAGRENGGDDSSDPGTQYLSQSRVVDLPKGPLLPKDSGV